MAIGGMTQQKYIWSCKSSEQEKHTRCSWISVLHNTILFYFYTQVKCTSRVGGQKNEGCKATVSWCRSLTLVFSLREIYDVTTLCRDMSLRWKTVCGRNTDTGSFSNLQSCVKDSTSQFLPQGKNWSYIFRKQTKGEQIINQEIEQKKIWLDVEQRYKPMNGSHLGPSTIQYDYCTFLFYFLFFKCNTMSILLQYNSSLFISRTNIFTKIISFFSISQDSHCFRLRSSKATNNISRKRHTNVGLKGNSVHFTHKVCLKGPR